MGRNLYKAVVIMGGGACALGTGLALWSADVVNALVCVVAGCLLVATHLNHVSSVGQFRDLGGRIDRGLQSLSLGLLDRVDRSNGKLEASIVQIDQKVKDLLFKQIEMKETVVETQTTMVDILRRVKINHKAIVTAEDELTKHVIAKSAMTLLAMREMQSFLEQTILLTKDQIDDGVSFNVSGLLKEIRSSKQTTEQLLIAFSKEVASSKQATEDRLGRATIEVQDVIAKNGQALRLQIDKCYDSLRVQLERSPEELAGLMSAAAEERLGGVTIEVQDVVAKNGQALRRRIDQHYDSLRVQLERAPGELAGLMSAVTEDRIGRVTIEVQDVVVKNGQTLRHQIDQRYDSLRVQLERAPGELAGLMSVANDLFLSSTDIPLLGGWAVSAPTLTALLKEIGRNPGVENVVECGSGASTIWCGLACRKRGHGHVYALEHDPKFADMTRSYIARNGLDPWVTVVDAPLIPYVVEGVEYRWYSLKEIEGVEKIDLLFVDGPPGDTGPMARYPAFQLLAPKLFENAWVVLDDTVRKEERDIAAMWCEKQVAGLSLTLLQELPKSMILIAKRSLGA